MLRLTVQDGDFVAEHEIYRADAILEYPQSGERIRGRSNIQASRAAQPNAKRFNVRRILGGGDLWVSELVLKYDDQPFGRCTTSGSTFPEMSMPSVPLK